MKTPSLAVGLLLSTVLFALPGHAATSAPRSGGCVSAEATSPATLSVSFEQNLTPAPQPLVPKHEPPAWCTSRTTMFCTYDGWNWMTLCCYATFIAPGASCPTYCE
jgi:hypothetical protein